MNADLARLLNEISPLIPQAFVVFLRIGAAMALMPAFGEQVVPMRVRLAAAISFTLIVFPAVKTDLSAIPVPLTPPAVFGLLGEVMVGLAIGIMLRMFIAALQMAGMIIAQSISLAQMFGGADGQPQPVISNMLTMAGLAIAVHLNLHVKVAALLIQSYEAFPLGQVPDADLLRAWGLSGVVNAFSLAFSIAAPFMLAGLVYNVALGAINRAMPQLMVVFIGAPALTFGGMVLLAVALPSGLSIWYGNFEQFLADPFVVPP